VKQAQVSKKSSACCLPYTDFMLGFDPEDWGDVLYGLSVIS
jgi:hypothetical protein